MERYNPLTGTFFTPVREMRLSLHELYEISDLVIGDALYEEYAPTTKEVHLLKKEDPQVYTRKCYVTSTSVDRRLEEQGRQADVLGELPFH